MADASALQKLLVWLSPAFPVGAFAYSAGLESAIADGRIRDRASTSAWIEGNLIHGTLRIDAIFAAAAYRASDDNKTLCDLADLCLALTPARERHSELLVTGRAFIEAAKAWAPVHKIELPQTCPYPVALGALGAAHGLELEDLLPAFLTALVQAQISVAVRLVPIGQQDGLAAQSALELTIRKAAAEAMNATLDDIGSIAYATDIATMDHERLTTRIFRS